MISRTTNETTVPRLIQLDVLRGLAILLVLGFHSILEPADAGWLRFPATVWHRIGWTGVDLFFVLSGYLVGGLLIKEYLVNGQIDVTRFLIRRGFKIWPAYYVFVTVASLTCLPLSGQHVPSLSSLWPGLLFLQNYLGTPFGHTWSLAVEEHFYLLLPAMLWLLCKVNRNIGWRLLPQLLGSLIFVVVCFRCWALLRTPYHYRTHHWPTHIRIDGLLFGVLLAYLIRTNRRFVAWVQQNRARLLLGGLLLLLPALKMPLDEFRFMYTLGYTILYVAYGAILLGTVETARGQGLLGTFLNTRTASALAFVGTYSYSIYLWHLELGALPLRRVAGWAPLLALPATMRWAILQSMYCSLAIAVGVLMGRMIEMPALSIRERLFPARAARTKSLSASEAEPMGAAACVQMVQA